MTQFNRSGTDKGMDRRCPQWWAVFDVLHGIDTYQVQCDDVMQNKWRCFCRSWIYGGHVTCKHIEQVMRHACPASANHPAGPNDLASAGITITNKPHYVPRYGNGKPASVATSQRCACGELMRQPQLRMDAAGNQIIQLEYAGRKYLFAWAGEPKRCGDRLPVSVLPPRLREYYDTPEQTVVVVALGNRPRRRTQCDRRAVIDCLMRLHPAVPGRSRARFAVSTPKTTMQSSISTSSWTARWRSTDRADRGRSVNDRRNGLYRNSGFGPLTSAACSSRRGARAFVGSCIGRLRAPGGARPPSSRYQPHSVSDEPSTTIRWW